MGKKGYKTEKCIQYFQEFSIIMKTKLFVAQITALWYHGSIILLWIAVWRHLLR